MTPTTPMRAIRAKCLDCSAGSSDEVKNCTVKTCPLYGYRRGKNPNRSKRVYSPEQLTAMKNRLQLARVGKQETKIVDGGAK